MFRLKQVEYVSAANPGGGHWTVEVAIISHGTQTSPMPPKLADGTRYNFLILVFQENNSGDKSREVEWEQ